MYFKKFGAGTALLALVSFGGGLALAQDKGDVPEPVANREFRAAWVATVANIDWPSKRGLSTAEQQAEILTILDKCAEMNLNAVVLQVRPAADAIYQSEIEPWSDVITGEMGKAPEPYYDPLTYWVDEAHKRGIEVHCWFNPYRAMHTTTKKVSDNHISKTNPEIAKKYGGYFWLNPTDKRVQDLSMKVIMDVVKRYDIDGVHMDDYFYPYPSYADGADFPDEDTWAEYQKSGGELSKGDWRREAVDKFVERLYNDVKAAKPHVKIGISPFGIARPGKPEQVASGFDQYAELYADAQKWLNEGWVDYYTPQLYWPIASPQPFMYLLDWWQGQNTHNRHIWPGLYTSKYAGTSETLSEVSSQIAATRFMNANGHVHFSMKPLVKNEHDISDRLKKDVYQEAALVPASTWIEEKAPEAPEFKLGNFDADSTGTVDLSFKMGNSEEPWVYALYKLNGKKWNMQVVPGTSTTLTLKADAKGNLPSQVALSAVDRNGNESDKVILKVSSKVRIEDAAPKVDQVQ